MSQNYVVYINKADLSATPTILITNKIPDKVDFPSNLLIVSAGTVTFKPATCSRGIMADVTHGSLALGITVDTNQMTLDQDLLEKTFF